MDSEYGYFHGPYDLCNSLETNLVLSAFGSNICGVVVDEQRTIQCGCVCGNVRSLRRHIKDVHFARDGRYSEWTVRAKSSRPTSEHEQRAAEEALRNYVLHGAFRKARFKTKMAVNEAKNIAHLIGEFEQLCKNDASFAASHPLGFRTSRYRPSKPRLGNRKRPMACIKGLSPSPPSPSPSMPDPVRPLSATTTPSKYFWIPCVMAAKTLLKEDTRIITPSGFPSAYIKPSPWLERVHVTKINKALGNQGAAFCQHEGESRPVLREPVVTMEILRFRHEREIEYCSWKRLQGILSKLSGCDIFSDAVLYLYPLSLEPKHRMQMFELEERLLQWQHSTGKTVRVFPRKSELMQETGKIGDIRALDELASAPDTPSEYAFRPVTCFGHGPCALEHAAETFMKRSNSSDSADVKVIQTHSDDLSCYPIDQPQASSPFDPLNHWFHQQLVPTFAKIGEFRVFIVAQSAPTQRHRRHRQGRILKTLSTVPEGPPNNRLDIQVASGWDFDDLPKLSLSALEKFALYVYEGLRARPDWYEGWESLEIGARLDVGISPDGDSFFVNEVTRIYAADLMSAYSLVSPFLTYCEAYAAAIDAYFNSPRSAR